MISDAPSSPHVIITESVLERSHDLGHSSAAVPSIIGYDLRLGIGPDHYLGYIIISGSRTYLLFTCCPHHIFSHVFGLVLDIVIDMRSFL